jgi:hypothetical protein
VRASGLYQLTPNAAGTRLAGDSFKEGVGDPRLVVIDLARRPISARSIPLPIDPVGSTHWIHNDRFAYFGADRILVYSATLRLTTRIPGWKGQHAAIHGTTAFGVHRGALVAAKLPAGPVRVVRRLPGTPAVIGSARS